MISKKDSEGYRVLASAAKKLLYLGEEALTGDCRLEDRGLFAPGSPGDREPAGRPFLEDTFGAAILGTKSLP